MRCRRCQFENIPGQKTCIKCGSTLEIESEAINIYPPRMSGWQSPLRRILRWIRRGRIVPQRDIKLRAPSWFKSAISDSLLGLFLSVIPGLAHIIQKRFGEIHWYFLAWLTLLLLGLFLYGSSAGFIILGLAIGVHAGIGLQYGILKDLANLREKIITGVLFFIGLAFIYALTPRVIVPNLTGGYSSLTIPYHKVETGDYLLAWRKIGQQSLLPRGSLVLMHPAILTSHRMQVNRSRDVIIGEIVGLGSEQLKISGSVFIVDGQQLDAEKYPVPEWLRNRNFSVRIPDDSYFVSAQYNVRIHGNVSLSNAQISQVCLTKASDIEAKAFMRWWPLLKRGFLR